jgi:putative membrane protein
MAFLAQAQKDNIAEAIRKAESNTSGEFVAVVASASDSYYYIPLLWSALFALAIPSIIALLPVATPGYTVLQAITFVVCALLFRWQPLKMRLIPKPVKHRRAQLLAREQFLAQGVHNTALRNGILLFVSVAERYVEIIADKGVNDVVPDNTWDQLIQQFVGSVKAGRIEQGFVDAVTECGRLLQTHFPVSEKDINELPNHLVELR